MSDSTVMQWLGVDVGWVYPAADSDGRIYRWADARTTRSVAQTTSSRCGPVTIRRADGTVESQAAYDSRQMAELSNRSDYNTRCEGLSQTILHRCKSTYRGIALEDWSDDRRHANFVALYNALVRNARKRGIPIALVDRAYTSQTCPECKHVDPANRAERNWFECVNCGNAGQADIIAATNISARASEPGARFLTSKVSMSDVDLKVIADLTA